MSGRKDSEFVAPGARGPSLSNAGYDGVLFESTPFFRTMKQAVAGWVMPSAADPNKPPLSRVLPPNDPRLVPTIARPGREAWQERMVKLVTAAGAVQSKPSAFYLAGPMGVGKVAAAKRFFEAGVFPQQTVRADSDELHSIIPELNELLALGDGRAADVVHEETSLISRTAYERALSEKRDVVHNSMFGTDFQLQRLKAAKDKGFKRVTVALVSSLDVAKERAGANGAWFDEKVMSDAHAQFSKNFDRLVAESDELVLVRNTGQALELIGHAKAGALTVTNQASYDAFRAMGRVAT